MYQPYPSGSQMPGQPQRPVAPAPVLMAVKLMYVGAGLSALVIVYALVTIGSLKSAILKAHPLYTTSQLNTAQTSAVVVAAVGGLITIGLWIWMARANGAGHKWARIVATVLFAINTLDLLITTVHSKAVTVVEAHAGIQLTFGAVIWLAGLGAFILLWRGESSQYIAAASGQPAG
jgi:hypothetical protein